METGGGEASEEEDEFGEDEETLESVRAFLCVRCA